MWSALLFEQMRYYKVSLCFIWCTACRSLYLHLREGLKIFLCEEGSAIKRLHLSNKVENRLLQTSINHLHSRCIADGKDNLVFQNCQSSPHYFTNHRFTMHWSNNSHWITTQTHNLFLCCVI